MKMPKEHIKDIKCFYIHGGTSAADKVTQGDIPLGLMQTSLRSRLGRMPHGRHIKE